MGFMVPIAALGAMGMMAYSMSRKPPAIPGSQPSTDQAAASAAQSVATEESVQRRKEAAQRAYTVLGETSSGTPAPITSSPLQAATKRSVLG